MIVNCSKIDTDQATNLVQIKMKTCDIKMAYSFIITIALLLLSNVTINCFKNYKLRTKSKNIYSDPPRNSNTSKV